MTTIDMEPQWGCCRRAPPSSHEAQRSSVSSSNTSEEEHLSLSSILSCSADVDSGLTGRICPHGDCWTFWNGFVLMFDSSASTHAHTFTDSSHTLNHWDTHRASVYLMTNLNWSCYSCLMGRPAPLCLPPARSSEDFRLIFCPFPASSVFLFWPSWAKLSLSVYQLGARVLIRHDLTE